MKLGGICIYIREACSDETRNDERLRGFRSVLYISFYLYIIPKSVLYEQKKRSNDSYSFKYS